MIKVVSGEFTAEQLIVINRLALDGNLAKGKNHFYKTDSGPMWVSDHCWKRGQYDEVVAKDGGYKIGVIRFTEERA